LVGNIDIIAKYSQSVFKPPNKGSFPHINKLKGRIIMKEKERVREMNEIIEMERAEEAKHEKEINDVEENIKKDEEKYNAKINEIENELLEEQDREGVFHNQSKNN
jgi:hypothetical protein